MDNALKVILKQRWFAQIGFHFGGLLGGQGKGKGKQQEQEQFFKIIDN